MKMWADYWLVAHPCESHWPWRWRYISTICSRCLKYLVNYPHYNSRTIFNGRTTKLQLHLPHQVYTSVTLEHHCGTAHQFQTTWCAAATGIKYCIHKFFWSSAYLRNIATRHHSEHGNWNGSLCTTAPYISWSTLKLNIMPATLWN